MKKTQWIINYSCNSTKINIFSDLESHSRNFELYTWKFEKLLVIGDLNISLEGNSMKHFCESYNLKSWIKVTTCYKNPDNPH